jgi:hypothetical protein
MKRSRVLGPCLVAAFACSAMVATGAQAAKPETGEEVVTATNGPAHLGTSKGTISSSSASGGGNLTSAFGGTAQTTFSGVESEATKTKCHSAGEPEGDVQTTLLAEETGWISKAKNEAGVDFKAASGVYLAEFECGPLAVKVKDSVIGHVTPLNVSSLESKLDLLPNTTGTANSPEALEGGAKDVLETEFSSFPGQEFESVQDQPNVSVKNHGNSTVCKLKKGTEVCKPQPGEFNTLVNPARPEFGRCVKKGAGEKYSDPNCTTPGPFKNGKNKGKYGFVPL